MKEVKEEVKTETPEKIRKSARNNGIFGIVLGIIGIIIPAPFSILIGFGALILGRNAITKGEKRLGIIAGVLGLIAVLSFLFAAGFNTVNFGI